MENVEKGGVLRSTEEYGRRLINIPVWISLEKEKENYWLSVLLPRLFF